MHVTVLAVPDCPQRPVLDERLTEALDGLSAVTDSSPLIATEDEAARSRMHRSPTILIDGLDPFARPGQPVSVSRRLYRDSDGRTGGAPSVRQVPPAARLQRQPMVTAQPSRAGRPRSGGPERPDSPG